MLIAIDGNNSVKRDVTSGQADHRIYDTSDFYLSRGAVNVFQDEVNRTKAERKKMVPLTLMFFSMLFNYTILRDTKDVLVVTAPQSGALSTCH